ncbi:hypothetical protein HYC85_012128 [Camellia sinensis]|uniref:Cyclic nucleotide-binding domain-containing protein n=1 Tax=Camellia sinensis TaxID=4442 RepID=A0A7J7HBY6_CAMSI|nr:hypothetical protein HYC85_012128 [Camellia sinensis]
MIHLRGFGTLRLLRSEPGLIPNENSPANSSVSSNPLHKFKLPFPLPSPAKHIRALLARRHGSVKPNEASIPEGNEIELGLDKNFGFSKQFMIYYELGEEVGRGHFGYTCSAKAKKWSLKGQDVAVKLIQKSKVMQRRGGKYSEEDAKAVVLLDQSSESVDHILALDLDHDFLEFVNVNHGSFILTVCGFLRYISLRNNKPLQASVRAVTSGTLWALKREDFRGILTSEFSNLSSLKLLRSIDLLSRLTILQLSHIAESLSEVSFSDGQIIADRINGKSASETKMKRLDYKSTKLRFPM